MQKIRTAVIGVGYLGRFHARPVGAAVRFTRADPFPRVRV